MTRIIHSLDEISADYDALFCDLWGCVHDGEKPFPVAVEALLKYRKAGGAVVLVTNAPRQAEAIQRHLDKMGLPRDAYDAIASSGDAARAAMFNGAVGEKVFFMGEKHDLVFFEPMAEIEHPVEIERVPLEDAEGIVCCGPFDPLAPLEESRAQLLYGKVKGMKLLCANPDIVVDRGSVREWCAGALAEIYTEMGGESLYFGKPHPPIYDLARRRLALATGKKIDDFRILAIGDGIKTDVQGAIGEDLDSLYITGGLAAEETRTGHSPEEDALMDFLDAHQLSPTYAAGFLR